MARCYDESSESAMRSLLGDKPKPPHADFTLDWDEYDRDGSFISVGYKAGCIDAIAMRIADAGMTVMAQCSWVDGIQWSFYENVNTKDLPTWEGVAEISSKHSRIASELFCVMAQSDDGMPVFTCEIAGDSVVIMNAIGPGYVIIDTSDEPEYRLDWDEAAEVAFHLIDSFTSGETWVQLCDIQQGANIDPFSDSSYPHRMRRHYLPISEDIVNGEEPYWIMDGDYDD